MVDGAPVAVVAVLVRRAAGRTAVQRVVRRAHEAVDGRQSKTRSWSAAQIAKGWALVRQNAAERDVDAGQQLVDGHSTVAVAVTDANGGRWSRRRWERCARHAYAGA